MFCRVSNILCIFCLFIASVSAKDLVLSFDDAPIAKGPIFSIEERHEKTLLALKEKNVKAAFFVLPKHSEIFESNYQSFRAFSEHYLANHSYQHMHLSPLKAESYLADLLHADLILSRFSNYKRWFRYPFLDYGQRQASGGSVDKAKAIAQDLHTLGFRHAYVSIECFDWYIQSLIQSALKKQKSINFERLKDLYLQVLRQSILEAPEQEEPYVLLLHSNDLNALFIKDIIEEFEKMQWRVVDPKLAFESENLLSNFNDYKQNFKERTGEKKAFISRTEYIQELFEKACVVIDDQNLQAR